MALKIAINGFGRIGRCVARIIDSRDDVELVCVNDTADRAMTKQLLKYDSVHGVFPGSVALLEDDYMQIGKANVKMFSTRDPKALNFADYGVDVVLECTGALLTLKDTQVFIDNGIKRVVMSAPAKDDTPTFVIGVNEHYLCRSEHCFQCQLYDQLFGPCRQNFWMMLLALTKD